MSALGESRRFFRYQEEKKTDTLDRCPYKLRESVTEERLRDLLGQNGGVFKCYEWQLDKLLNVGPHQIEKAVRDMEERDELATVCLPDDQYLYQLNSMLTSCRLKL